MHLSDQFCVDAGLPHQTTVISFLESQRDISTSQIDGLLGTDESKAAAIETLQEISQYEIRIVKQLAHVQEKYLKVHIEGEANPVLVALLDDCQRDSFPTDMENLILWGIFQHGSPLAREWIDSEDGRKLNWRKMGKGLAIVAQPYPPRDGVNHTVAALLGLQDGGLGSTAPLAPVAELATELHIGSPVRTLNQVQARLFFEAVATNHPKWRFLSFYRLLENAYLTSIKKVLLIDFDKDAARAIEEAKKKLQSEVNQLIDLMTQLQLNAEFIAFNSAFESQMAAGNQYVIALDRGAQDDNLYRSPEIQKKAVLRFYKMRCSIAHAGTSSVIFEQMTDAMAGTAALLPAVEAIVLKSLAVTTTN